jgi:hypothetical protein
MTETIEIRMGTGRKVLLVPGYAIKVARTDRTEHPLRKGFEDNLREAGHWQTASAAMRKTAMRKILCPVLFVTTSGDLLVMPYAAPIPPVEWEAAQRLIDDRYSDAYQGPASSIPFEIKRDTCGYLNGEPVVVDYGDKP